MEIDVNNIKLEDWIRQIDDVYEDNNPDFLHIDINLPIEYDILNMSITSMYSINAIMERIKELWDKEYDLDKYKLYNAGQAYKCYLNIILQKK